VTPNECVGPLALGRKIGLLALARFTSHRHEHRRLLRRWAACWRVAAVDSASGCLCSDNYVTEHAHRCICAFDVCNFNKLAIVWQLLATAFATDCEREMEKETKRER